MMQVEFMWHNVSVRILSAAGAIRFSHGTEYCLWDLEKKAKERQERSFKKKMQVYMVELCRPILLSANKGESVYEWSKLYEQKRGD